MIERPIESIDQKKILIEESVKRQFGSHFNFLKSHNNWRNGKIHLFLGTTHGGKSTLARSLLVDLLEFNNKKTLLWLSEESELEFVTEFARSAYDNKEKLKNLEIISETDLYEKNSYTDKELLKKFEQQIKLGGYDFLFFDNLTTSNFYMDKRTNVQSSVAKYLKKLCKEVCIPFVIFAHTGANITDDDGRFIKPNDIRGNKSIINLAQFLYILQTIKEGEGRRCVIRTEKHRGQDLMKSLHVFDYHKASRLYAQDKPISYEDFKEWYKRRNRL